MSSVLPQSSCVLRSVTDESESTGGSVRSSGGEVGWDTHALNERVLSCMLNINTK